MTDPDVVAVRPISGVDELKAIADATRLGILTALMRPAGGALPVRSVKELAAELGQPQTMLYRHVKQLEAVGLIKAVTRRVVSGIVEHRYQACQRDLMLGAGLTDAPEASKDVEAAVAAVFELYRKQLFAARRAQLHGETTPEEGGLTLSALSATISRARAAAVREELQRVLRELAEADQAGEQDDAVTVNVLLGFFSSEVRQG